MDRKGIIAVTLAVVGLVIWQINYSRQMDVYQRAKRAADAEAAAAEKAKHPDATAETPKNSTAPAANATSTPGTPKVEEKLERITTPSVEYAFTNLGGGIARVVLLKHIAEPGGKRAGDLETKVTLNAYGDLPIGAVVESTGDDARLPFTATINDQTGEATFERTDNRQLQTVKKFTVVKEPGGRDEYLVGFDLTFNNQSQQAISVPGYLVHTGSAGPVHRLDLANYTGFDWYTGGNTFKDVTSFHSGGIFGFGRVEQPTFSLGGINANWAGVTNQYFCTIITPSNAKAAGVWCEKFGIDESAVPAATPDAAPSGANLLGVHGALSMAGFTLAPGQSVTQHFDIYAGPREYNRLKKLGGDQDEIMDFGTYIKFVSEALLGSMNWLHSHLGSYAAAIIVLTLIIRSLMWPLQNKSTESMKKMQALGPRMNELKEKYQDDPQRMNMEVMKLYKENGVNPLSGCLPMFIQIPIFWGLFRMLGKAVELRNSHFLWVHDLSQPDTIAHLLGKPLNILPLCMAATMLVQMRLSPKTGDDTQQKVLMFMPVIFVLFCYNYASALALYWTVQNLFSIGQLYVTRNRTTPVLVLPSGGKRSKKKGNR